MNKIYKTKWWGTKFRRKFVWLSHQSWDISDHTVNLIGYNFCRFDKTIWAVTNVGSHTSCIPKQLAFSLWCSTWKPCAEHILNCIRWERLELLIILCFRWFLHYSVWLLQAYLTLAGQFPGRDKQHCSHLTHTSLAVISRILFLLSSFSCPQFPGHSLFCMDLYEYDLG